MDGKKVGKLCYVQVTLTKGILCYVQVQVTLTKGKLCYAQVQVTLTKDKQNVDSWVCVAQCSFEIEPLVLEKSPL